MKFNHLGLPFVTASNRRQRRRITVSLLVYACLGIILNISTAHAQACTTAVTKERNAAYVRNLMTASEGEHIAARGEGLALATQRYPTDHGSKYTADSRKYTTMPTLNKTNEPWVVTNNTVRINQDDPVLAAIAVSRIAWPALTEEGRPNGIVLVTKEHWGIAAAAAHLIHHPLNAPLLYTDQDRIPEATRQEIARLRPKGIEKGAYPRVIVVGNVHQSVWDQLKAMGFDVRRIASSEPAQAAADVDLYMSRTSGQLSPTVVVGSLDAPAFTLPAVNWTAHMPEPLLFVTKDGIPQATADALAKRRKTAVIYIIGPRTAVSAETAAQLSAFGRVERIEGANPTANAVAFARYKDPNTGFGWGIMTPGHNFSLALGNDPLLIAAAAPFAHKGKHAPLLLTDGGQIPPVLRQYLEGVRPTYDRTPAEGPYNAAWLLGTASSLTPALQGAIDDLLEISSSSGGHAAHHGGHGA
ncbi:cell wall-binding repeat-containing protein [Paenibacillus sp. UMB4589-SE434]|uniref:cell wall-binding repeat-containing protein n=1 Tax=Paenibacillus sp. UMB4589-SE434 TaxID=3046314 RepID=UPI00254D9F55|nr:cell wall-binding repeat-containing protein [Paenibacillus sp. UMB4589-SE434]MDK8182827.1 cell wall-binding repeat-containing protein [Paenibacillus sp. UMB4589-SE434]